MFARKQAADNVMIAEEERRRIAVRLVQDVRSAYWRAVSAERVLYRVKFLDESVNKALERAQQIVDKKLQTPLTPLNYRRDLLNIQREVQRLYRELSTARVQLASMMGLPPGTEYDLAVPQRASTVPVVDPGYRADGGAGFAASRRASLPRLSKADQCEGGAGRLPGNVSQLEAESRRVLQQQQLLPLSKLAGVCLSAQLEPLCRRFAYRPNSRRWRRIARCWMPKVSR
jgi:hypothetical protein